MAAVIICHDFGDQKKKKKSVTVSTVSPSICHEVMGLEIICLNITEYLLIRQQLPILPCL